MTFKQFRTIVDMDKDFTVFFVDESKSLHFGEITFPELYDSYRVDGFMMGHVNIVNETELPTLRDVMINFHEPSDGFELVYPSGESIGFTFDQYLEHSELYSNLEVEGIVGRRIYLK